jgi:preprotein translocase subunit YajC
VTSQLLTHELLLAQNVLPKAGTPGVVQQDATPASTPASSSSSSPLMSMLPMLLMFALFIPILFLSSRRQKKEQKARESLKKGDRVQSTSGLIGELVEMDERIAKVKIAPSVHVQLVASTVSPYVEAEKAPAKEIKEVKAVAEKK